MKSILILLFAAALQAQSTRPIFSGTYTSGGSITGTAGQLCGLAIGSDGGTATVALGGTNTIAPGTPLRIQAAALYATPPTSAVLNSLGGFSGAATCTGTAVISTMFGFDGSIGAQTSRLRSPGNFARSVQDKLNETVSVKDFGATGDGVTDDTVAIQAAMDTPCNSQGGCALYFPMGRYSVSATLHFHRPQTTLRGDMPTSNIGSLSDPTTMGWGTVLVPTAGHPGPVISADTAEMNAYLGTQWTGMRGVSVSNFAIDLLHNPSITGFQLRTLSNVPDWSNIVVFHALGMALDIDSASGPHGAGAGVTEGINFRNLYVFAEGNAATPAIAPAVRLRGANEIIFDGGKLLVVGGVPDTSGFALMSIESNAQPSFSVQLRGMSFGGYKVGVRVQGNLIPGFSPYNISVIGCTFEGYDTAIALNDQFGGSTPTTNIRSFTVDSTTRFQTSFLGATRQKVYADWTEASYFDVSAGTDYLSNAVFTANTSANFIRGSYLGRISNLGHNAVEAVSASGGSQWGQYMSLYGVIPNFTITDPTAGSAVGIIQAWGAANAVQMGADVGNLQLKSHGAIGLNLTNLNAAFNVPLFAPHFYGTGTSPGIALGFGTSPSIAGSDSGGRITVGAGGVWNHGTVNFGASWTNPPSCTANDETSPIAVQVSTATNTMVLSSIVPWNAGDKLTWTCLGF